MGGSTSNNPQETMFSSKYAWQDRAEIWECQAVLSVIFSLFVVTMRPLQLKLCSILFYSFHSIRRRCPFPSITARRSLTFTENTISLENKNNFTGKLETSAHFIKPFQFGCHCLNQLSPVTEQCKQIR